MLGSNPTPDKSMENIDLFYQFIGLEQWKANLSEKIFQLVYSVIFFYHSLLDSLGSFEDRVSNFRIPL